MVIYCILNRLDFRYDLKGLYKMGPFFMAPAPPIEALLEAIFGLIALDIPPQSFEI